MKPWTAHSTEVVCTFACQDKYYKSDATSYLNWRNDGKNGPEEPANFKHYIIKWLLRGHNFNKWRFLPSGQTKFKVTEHIESLLYIYGMTQVKGSPTMESQMFQ